MTASSKLALGTVQFGLNYGIGNKRGQISFSEAKEIVSLGKKNDINVIDTAIAYGSSEEVLGKVGVDGFRLVTKLPPLHRERSDTLGWLRNQVESSLKRLKQKNLYGLLLHHPKDLLNSNGKQLIDGLIVLRNEGFVKKIGVSIYSPDDLDWICNRIQIDLVQAPLNVVDRKLQSSGWMDRLKDEGIEIHTRSAFLQGLLLMGPNKIPEKFLKWSNLWAKWDEMLKTFKISPLEACLAYPFSLDQVDQVIVGVDSAEQLQEIVTAANAVNCGLDTSFMKCADTNLINPSNWAHL